MKPNFLRMCVEAVAAFIGICLLLLCVAFLAVSLFAANDKATQTALKAMLTRYTNFVALQVLFALTTLVGGTLLYVLRCRRPITYGMLEAGIGLYITAVTVNFAFGISDTSNALAFSVLGALYIIVRGYDNIYRGMKKGSFGLRTWNDLFFGKDTYEKL